jgi:hypothetical protein
MLENMVITQYVSNYSILNTSCHFGGVMGSKVQLHLDLNFGVHV